MKHDDPNLKPQYRMPRVFGALPGPRNVPRDKQHLPNNQTNLVLSITALTDKGLLSELLPPDCTLFGEPTLTITMTVMSNIGWLAGRGYSILSVGFPIAHQSKERGERTGNFTPVLWENLADPIVTGREELGFAKIYADIPPPVIIGNRYSARALWQGFQFFEMEIGDLTESSDRPPVPPSPTLGSFHYKFILRTGALGEPDCAYLEYASPNRSATGYGGLRIVRRLTGNGSFRFHRARWEDVPFQYPIINALADLPIREMRAASVTYQAAEGLIGDPSAQGLEPMDALNHN
ncbi:MAG: acetoacetate decarboxylase family protein [Burkholderiales bacterium]